ncbi:unnamed protein product [Hymenolepis diminuta]|uniref:Uncharacterized protein n=1 Tax=Hymenolepis diminuta TaxID=6216 RepID=A0A564YX72_HYMDI|nr:unnamed protein product [Hymenolepis diminuta]
MTVHLPTERTRSPSDFHTRNIRSSHFQDAGFVENVILIETAPYEDVTVRISMTVITKRATVENLLRVVKRDRAMIETVSSSVSNAYCDAPPL